MFTGSNVAQNLACVITEIEAIKNNLIVLHAIDVTKTVNDKFPYFVTITDARNHEVFSNYYMIFRL